MSSASTGSGAIRDVGVFVGGSWVRTDEQVSVLDKFSGEIVGRVGVPSREQVAAAIEAATAAVWSGAFPLELRLTVLQNVARLVGERVASLAELHTAETGFTLTESTNEIHRTVRTLELCAEEVRRLSGDMVPIAWYPGSEDRRAYTELRPVGPVCAITPFNSPLNTVAHKLGPAFGAGNSVVLKPAEQSPLCATMLADIFVEAGLPQGYLSIVFGGPDVGQQMLEDPRFGFYAFTGSSRVGEHISKTIGLRRSQLELGSIASTVVCADADIETVVAQATFAGFRKAGQVCTSVQRIVAHESIAKELALRLAESASALVVGDPRDPATNIGPMIDESAAVRACTWVREAVEGGAQLLAGGTAAGALMKPTVLFDVTPDMKVMCQEAFAPLISVVPFRDLDEAIAVVNSSQYGLAAGVFSNDIRSIRRVVSGVRVGTVQINATSSNRYDSMPFGGVKASGFGKEGPYYAMRAMSDEVLVVWN